MSFPGGMSAQPSGTNTGTRRGNKEGGGHLVLGASHFPAAALPPTCPPFLLLQTHFPAPTLLPLGDALWGSGQFAYILIYKKLSALADSEPGLHSKELNNLLLCTV